MGPIQQWDIETFRAINGLRSSFLDPIFLVVTATGLGHVQLMLLLGLGLRRRSSISRSNAEGGVPSNMQPRPLSSQDSDFPLPEEGDSKGAWRMHPAAVNALIAGLVAGLIRLPLMRIADRMRPSNLAFAKPMENVFGNSSFPSGHTTTSFAIAVAVLVSLPAGQKKWGWGLLAWALAVGFSRVYCGVHFPTDVLGGALLGSGVAGLVMAFRR